MPTCFALTVLLWHATAQIYTWMDATLRELSDLVKEVKPAARGRMTRLSFAFVYPDKRGRNVMRQVGQSMFFAGSCSPVALGWAAGLSSLGVGRHRT